jgi:CDP-glucose 4,6-dehydratase
MNKKTDYDIFFKNKKVLITGNSGFKGSWLVLYLHYLGAKIYGISKKEKISNLVYSSCEINKLCTQYFIDINNYPALQTKISEIKPDLIFHLAAQSLTINGYKNPLESFKTNGIGTANVLECARNYNNKCNVIIITSDKCYKNVEWLCGYKESDILGGIDPYSASKSVAELIFKSYYETYFRNSKMIFSASCRAGNVIGGGDWNTNRIIPDCIKSWQKKEAVVLRNPNSIRPWNFILDVIWGYLKTSILVEKTDVDGESFNFGPRFENEITVHQVVKRLWKTTNLSSFEPFIIESNLSNFKENVYLKLNIEKSKSLLNWQPITDIDNALKITNEWYDLYFSDRKKILNHSMQSIEFFHNNLKLNED